MSGGRSEQSQNKKRTRGATPTGTPRGWTFWATAERCWRELLLRYIVSMYPVVTKDALIIGTIYHALLDNWAPEAIAGWGPEYPKHMELGLKLYNARIAGPPLPKATASEKQHTLTFGMTSKPDREEKHFGGKPVIRDFKSTMFFSDNDDKSWAVNGGIIGEAVAIGAEKAIVDVICKQAGANFGRIQQFEVEIGPAQVEALEQAVNDARSEIVMRVDEALAAKDAASTRAAFPKKLSSCVGRYGVCDYYERCWGTGPEKHLFVENKRGLKWLKDEGNKELEKKVMQLRERLKGAV